MTIAAESAVVAPHAQNTYLPEPDVLRRGNALCLSGGGFRAALFHLGAVRRLHELGVLDQIDTIAATSGGTMLAAFLAQRCHLWRRHRLPCGEWERLLSAPFRKIASKNLNVIPILVGWLPWNWTNNAGLEAMADACETRGVTCQTTADLPDDPEFRFVATDIVSGAEFRFEKSNGIPRRIALAVSVCSAFPGFFRPFSESKPERIALLDGGIHDDRAVDSVWRSHARLLISDGGDVLRPEWGESVFWSLFRSAAVLFNQLQVVQKRWLIGNFIQKQLSGTYWSIDSSPQHYPHGSGAAAPPGYSLGLARDVIAAIRTDYDAFSDAEASVLENHGYFLADAAARAHLGSLGLDPTPLHVPHPTWMNEIKVRAALRTSAKKPLLGRW